MTTDAPYNFTMETTVKGWHVAVDPARRYGYFDMPDGSEGGGLWFEGGPATLRLVDQDGTSCCPKGVISALNALGITVPVEFR